MCDMIKSHFSFRLPSADRELLADQAGVREITESELARRYVTEGIRRDRHPLITFVPWRPGRAVLASRPRLEVADVIETWKLNSEDSQSTTEYFELPTAELRAVLDYYADFPDEIDASLKSKHAAATRLEKLSARGRRRA